MNVYVPYLDCICPVLNIAYVILRYFLIQKNHQGDTLMEEVAKHLDLLERDYFGLAYIDEGIMVGSVYVFV